jgi:SAM-dependent methyltransferase
MLMDDTDYALGRTCSEYDRLIEQAELLGPITERMLRAAGICAGMHVLDVGCGVGDVSFLVSALVGPRGSVVGVDLDRGAIEIAEKRCVEQRLANVSFREGDARTIKTGRLFDAAVGRLVLMFTSDPTVALRCIAERVHPGGIVAFHEWVGQVPSAMNQPVLASLQNLLSRTFARSGARLDIGAELYWRMFDAGLKPERRPLVEIAVDTERGTVAYRRWALIVRSLIPKIVEYGFATEKEVLHTIEQELRDELLATRSLTPLSWPMIGQWARKPML